MLLQGRKDNGVFLVIMAGQQRLERGLLDFGGRVCAAQLRLDGAQKFQNFAMLLLQRVTSAFQTTADLALKLGENLCLLPMDAPDEGILEFPEAFYCRREIGRFEGLKTMKWLADLFLLQPGIGKKRRLCSRMFHERSVGNVRSKTLT